MSSDDGTGGRVVSTIQHPAHVHFFRNAIAELEERNYDVRVFAREKDIAGELLESYDIEYRTLAPEPSSLSELLAVQAKYEYELLKRVRRLKPSVLLAIGEPAIAHASRVTDARSVLFSDTEHARLSNLLAFPFSDLVCTPSSYRGELGSNHVTYPGYHELAYLHPNRFSPDPAALEEIGADEDDLIVVLRLVSWNAAHDVANGGIERVNHVEALVEGLRALGATVVLSAESELPPSLAAHELDAPVDAIHDLLYYADLLVGESGTMSIESALLGTPALFVSSLDAGVLEELENEYGLLFSSPQGVTPSELLERARSILSADPSIWDRRRRRLLDEKIDTTEFIVRTVEEVAGS